MNQVNNLTFLTWKSLYLNDFLGKSTYFFHLLSYASSYIAKGGTFRGNDITLTNSPLDSK
jgi:hypothetical protein